MIIIKCEAAKSSQQHIQFVMWLSGSFWDVIESLLSNLSDFFYSVNSLFSKAYSKMVVSTIYLLNFRGFSIILSTKGNLLRVIT